MSTIRQSIVAALVKALKGISISDGYRSDVGSGVYQWPDPRLEAADLPALVLHDTTAPVEREPWPLFSHTLTVEIYIAAAGSAADSALSDIMADIFQAIGADITLGGLAVDTRPVECSKTEIEKYDKTIGDAVVIIEIDYRTDQWTL